VLATACLPAPGTATRSPDAVVAVAAARPAPPAMAAAPWRVDAPKPTDHPAAVDDAPALLLRGARLLIGNGKEITSGHVLLLRGRIAAVGDGPGTPPDGARVIELAGKTVTPGLIDTHSHMGVFPMPAAQAHDDGNEMTAATTGGARTLDAIWPFDPAFQRALEGGTTTVQVLPGSANLVGGRATTIKLSPARTARDLIFAGAPFGLKMACGENPKRVHGRGRHAAPGTRMGNLALQRGAFQKARRLIEEWALWASSETVRRKAWEKKVADGERRRDLLASKREACLAKSRPERCLAALDASTASGPLDVEPFEAKLPPARDLDTEALAAVLEGLSPVHVHCYRSDDMSAMLALGDEMGFQVTSFHHALEAYKIRGDLARRKVSVSTWADWFGFKLEANDGIPENLALIHATGADAIVHTDSPEGVRRMNQEAAKGLWAGRHAGLAIGEADAIRWVTENPARALGVDRWVGTLEVGKDADIVVWSGNPFSVYTRADLVLVDGKIRHDAASPAKPWSDFEVEP